MTAHKHAEMIKVKADNMELVIFCKDPHSSKWRKQISQDDMDFDKDIEYFLCHPKHEKECLYWLNGSDVVECEYKGEWAVVDAQNVGWSEHHFFMDASLTFRTKPRKEKRWIVVKNGMLQSNHLFKSDNEAVVVCGFGGQFIEIEVEV